MPEPRLPLPAGVTARPWKLSDAPSLVLAFRDPLVRRYASAPVDDRSSAVQRVQAYTDGWRARDGASWALVDAGGSLVGSLRFALRDPALGMASVGYWLSPEVRGAGIASAAVGAGTHTVFATFGWRRVELYHAVENERSCSVARRSGYRLEGVMREAMHYPSDGEQDRPRWSDEHLHARLISDPRP